jgi:hypothetical protein
MVKLLCRGISVLLKKINMVSTGGRAWQQARLAAKHSGLGIHSPAINQPVVHLVSIIRVTQLLTKQQALSVRLLMRSDVHTYGAVSNVHMYY